MFEKLKKMFSREKGPTPEEIAEIARLERELNTYMRSLSHTEALAAQKRT